MKKYKKIDKFNDKIAQIINDATGNMYFFWASLLFVLVLRLSHPPSINELLLDIENDLQLLLLAVNAVMGAKQMAALTRIIKHIEKEEEKIEKELAEKVTK
ncbi:hypothetical protein Tsac_2841 [Thermoanaerobacterium phage THSA-485A]|uniref:hypothetical protein n=1 Tax=Thermoanaerobacterium phage THSA-485A TaxID=1126885 RepID=UPI000263F832|nr:hypothetical protein Tsac_2841 [Thermoanaerobacterium phage THSA-485A]AFK87694.1 hypothetical protein Tsac_2841 [Thermoanaerobacterium phage THSA-485A]